MRILLRYFLMALVLLVVALLSALTAMRLAIHGRQVRMRDLRSKTPAEARRIADDDGLATSVERNYYSATVPEGKVLSQVPAPGTVVRRGWELRLALSLGPQRVTVPQLVGGSERAANLTLAQRGIEIDSIARATLPGAAADQVVGQNPPANSANVSAPKVSLLFSQADSLAAFVVPSFVGQPLGTVTNTMHDAGFSVGRVTMMQPVSPPAQAVPNDNSAGQPDTSAPGPLIPNSPSPASIIVSQDPVPGAKVLAGSAINFVVK